MPTRDRIPPHERELLCQNELAGLLGLDRGTLREMVKRGMIPAPQPFGPRGGRLVWSVRMIKTWIDDGLPDPASWVYKPRLLVGLDELIKQRHQELRNLEQRIAESRSELPQPQGAAF